MIMRRFIDILSFVLCCIGLHDAESTVAPCREGAYDCAVGNCYDVQLECRNRYNLNIDSVVSLCVPPCNVSASHHAPRYGSMRILHSEVVGRNVAPLCRYCTNRYIHRLSPGERAVEYYLYTLCRIRI